VSERIVKLDVGCVPEAAISGPVLLQSDYSTFLVFNAMQERDGAYHDAGHAIVTFERCSITKFGYPNDEAWHAIPRTRGLSYDVHEVLDSDWIREKTRLNRYGFPDTPDSTARHFLILFHDSSFECIARDISVRLSNEPIADIVADLTARILAE
jgi:hypothetical protein